MSARKAKRFWTRAEVGARDGGFGLLLDGRALHTPAKVPLVVPTRALARAIAEEWQAQGETIEPATMPLTRTANAAIDKVAPRRREVIDMLAGYGDSDLLCYRADRPADLAARQAAAWDEYLDWCARALGARLEPRIGVMHRPQDRDVLARLKGRIEGLDNHALAAFHDLVVLSGSLVLALATIHGFRSVARTWEASRIDEAWQIEQWGDDAEARAAEKDRFSSFRSAANYHELARR